MSKKQFNSLAVFSENKNVNVDVENGILKNVEIAKFGKNKNNSYFNQKFLDDLVEKGNAQKQGVKSRFGHPNMCATSLGTYIGRFKEFTQKEGKVYATLYLDKVSKDTPNGNLYDYVINMAQNNPDMFGNSIVISCDWFDEEITNEAGEKETVESLILDEFISSDLVDDPAATDALFSSNPNDLGVIVTDFLDNNPSIFETISKNPNIIEDFFSRYANYTNRKSLINFNMNLFDKMKKKFSSKKEEETFDIELTLADGTIVTVVTEAEEPKVGDEVKDSEGNPVPDAEHMLPDGGSIVTVDGKITEIKEKEAEEGDDEPTPREVMNSINALSKKFDAFAKNVDKSNKEVEKTFDLLVENHNALSEKVEGLAKNTKSKYNAPPATPPKDKNQNSTSGYDPDKAKELRKNNSK